MRGVDVMQVNRVMFRLAAWSASRAVEERGTAWGEDSRTLMTRRMRWGQGNAKVKVWLGEVRGDVE